MMRTFFAKVKYTNQWMANKVMKAAIYSVYYVTLFRPSCERS